MKTLIMITLLLSSLQPMAKPSMQKKCDELTAKIEMQQFKYHDTVARMTVELRESSTPSIQLDISKINDHVRKLKKSKKSMSSLIDSKLYNQCF